MALKPYFVLQPEPGSAYTQSNSIGVPFNWPLELKTQVKNVSEITIAQTPLRAGSAQKPDSVSVPNCADAG